MVKKNFLKSSLVIAAVVAMIVAFLPLSGVKAASGVDKIEPALTYSAHVQNVGWTSTSKAGEAESDITKSFAGSEGKSQRLEALKLTFTAPTGATLSCNAHVQGEGWTGWTLLDGTDVLVGTEGQSKRLEAIKFSVTGLTGYEIKYRAHVQGYGWMEWVTADASQDLTKNFAGTQGECKRIEAIEVLILTTADGKADVFDARQQAIAELRAYVNPNEYTKNAKLLQEAIEKGIDDINKAGNTVSLITNALHTAQDRIKNTKTKAEVILSDRTIAENLAALNTAIDTTFSNSLNSYVRGNKELGLGLYKDVPAVVNALAVAKEAIANKDEYKLTDFTPNAGGKLWDEAFEEYIKPELRYYGLELLEEVYNKVATKDTDMVLDIVRYNSLKNDLSDKENGNNPLTISQIIGKINDITENYTLGNLRNAYVTALNAVVNVAPFNGAIFNQTTKNQKYAPKLKVLLSDQSVTNYKDLNGIKTTIASAHTKLDSAMSTPEFEAILAEAKANVLSELRLFINRTLDALSVEGNPTELVLRPATNTAYPTLQTTLADSDATALELVTAFENVIDKLVQKTGIQLS